MPESPSLEQLAALLSDPDEEQRRSAVMELLRFPGAAIRTLLMTALGDPSWRVRKEATGVLLAGTCDLELIGMLVNTLGAHSNAGLRNAAVEALVALGDMAQPVLVAALRDADGDTRKFIVDILGIIGNGDSRAALEALLEDPDLNVATAAAESLGRLAAPESLPSLVRALERPSLWFRYAVLEAIAAIGRPVAAPEVSSLAGDRLLRGAVFDCLGAIGDLKAVPLLLAGLGDATHRLKMSAAQALVLVRERLGDTERDALDRELRSFAGTDLPLKLGDRVDGGSDGCEALVKLLGIIGDPRAAGLLVRACRDHRLRPHCADALKGMANNVGPELARLYAEGEAEDRSGILWLCGEVAPSGCVDLLLRGCADASETVRAAAVNAAAGCDDADLVPVLASCCADPSPEVREEALLSLLRLAERFPDRAMTVAEELAGSPEVSLRRVAARLCSLSGAASRVEHLLRDEDPLVRSAAASGLKRSAPAALEHLMLLLTDEDPRVRTVAATVLGEIGGESAFEPLLAALSDEEPEVVCAALHSLAGQGAWAFSPVLDTVRRSGGGVLPEALEVLDRIDPGRAEEVLAEYLGHGDPEVVITALRLLAGHEETALLDRYAGELMHHPHWEVRSLLAGFLARTTEGRGRVGLEEMLGREDDPLVKRRIQTLLDGFR